jgi:hypothetical protein
MKIKINDTVMVNYLRKKGLLLEGLKNIEHNDKEMIEFRRMVHRCVKEDGGEK